MWSDAVLIFVLAMSGTKPGPGTSVHYVSLYERYRRASILLVTSHVKGEREHRNGITRIGGSQPEFNKCAI
jgi:hypothetical protein